MLKKEKTQSSNRGPLPPIEERPRPKPRRPVIKIKKKDKRPGIVKPLT